MNKLGLRVALMGLCWFSIAIVGLSFYLEYGFDLEPCPLCLMQRYLVALIGLSSFIASRMLEKRSLKPILGIQLFFCLSGGYFAGRQLWLQSLPPDKAPACMPSLDTLIHYFPWQDVLQALFLGSGDCAEDRWQFLGITLAAWSLLFFLCVFVATAVILWRNAAMRKEHDA